MRTQIPESRRLGAGGPAVFPFALGCMGMSAMYGPTDESESIATIHAALERGVTVIDTGDFYGSGRNELLIGRALRGRRERAILSVKFGAMRTPEGGWSGVVDSRPAAVKNFLAYSLARLGVDHIDIYRPSRLDPAVPIEDTVGAIAEMVKAGWVRHIGLSEVGAKTIRRAQAVHPICDLQIEYSLASRGPERDIFPAVAELGISVTAYGILSRGLLSGSAPAGASDLRSHMPRFSAANAEANRRAVAALGRLASQMGATPTQLAIAWVMARNPSLIPLVGARTRRQLDESLAAAAISLSGEEVARIGDALTPEMISGGRYQAQQMALLDSER